MKCLHGEPAAHSTTQNGSFWFCGQNPSCNFFCCEDEGYLYEKAITAWRATKQAHPQCVGHNKLLRMRVVRLDESKLGKTGSFWVWGDVRPLIKLECCHGFPCVVRKVKKEGLNKDRKFFCCPNDKESLCKYFDWVPEEPYQDVNFVEPQEEARGALPDRQIHKRFC